MEDWISSHVFQPDILERESLDFGALDRGHGGRGYLTFVANVKVIVSVSHDSYPKS